MVAIGTGTVSRVVDFVPVKKQRWVNPVVTEPHGVGPRPLRRLCGHIEVAATSDQRRDEIKCAFVVAQGRGVNARRTGDPVEIELTLAGQRVADLAPVHQVPAVEQWHSWKVLEAATCEIEVVPHPTDRRIGIAA